MLTSGGLFCLPLQKIEPSVLYCLRCFRRLRFPTISHSISTLPPHAYHYFRQLITHPFHTMNRNYSVFLSHADPVKESIPIPLYERLRERNIHAFLDREELHVGDNGPRVMEYAMNTARGRLHPQPRVCCPKLDHGRAHMLPETRARGPGEQTPSAPTHSCVLSP